MNEIKLEKIRIGNKEPVDLIIGEITWGDEEEITELGKEKKMDLKRAEEVISFNPVRMRRLRFIRSIKNIKVSEEDFLKTPKIDVKKIVSAYDILNELNEEEKRRSENESA